jgi:hypothetical protein
MSRRSVAPALHGLVGGVLLLAPGGVLRRIGDPAGRGTRVAARILGARHLAQATLMQLRPDRTAVTLGAATDSLHCASMLAAALLSRRHRRVALAAGLVAGALTTLELEAVRDWHQHDIHVLSSRNAILLRG